MNKTIDAVKLMRKIRDKLYDPEIDALYIRLIEGRQECRTVRLNEEIALNIGPGESLVGIEILDAKEILGSGKVPSVVLEGLAAASSVPVVRERASRKYGSSRGAKDVE